MVSDEFGRIVHGRIVVKVKNTFFIRKDNIIYPYIYRDITTITMGIEKNILSNYQVIIKTLFYIDYKKANHYYNI